MPNGKHSAPERVVNLGSVSLDKDLRTYADSPEFAFTVQKIESFLEAGGIEEVVEQIKRGILKPVEVKKIIRIYESQPEQEKFVNQLQQVLHEAFVYEHFFEVEDVITPMSSSSDLYSLMISGVKGFDRDTLQSLLVLYQDGRIDPDGECKEKVRAALNFVSNIK